MPSSTTFQAEKERERILSLPDQRQDSALADLVASDWQHKWLQGRWEDPDHDGDIEFSALQFDDGSALASFHLHKGSGLTRLRVASIVATFQPDEVEQFRSECLAPMPPLWLLQFWANEVQSA